MGNLDSNELYHHGILGMKWGVRRYQNPDGTLTEAGKKRYYNADGSFTDAGKKRLYKDAKNNIWSRDPKKHRRGTSLLNELEESEYLKAYASRLDAAKITEKRTRDELVKAERRNDPDVESKGKAYRDAKDEVYNFEKQIVKEILGKYGFSKNGNFTEAGFAVMNQLFSNSEQRYEKRDKKKKKAMDRAKKNDSYEIDFLETVQNDPVLGKGGKELLNEYSKYLDDPNKYMHEFDKSDYFKKNPNLDHEDSSEDYLEHWGILGMKWGVRRYQNKDGSLTSAGRSRYGSGKKKVGILEAHRIKKRKAEVAKKRAETLAKKKAEEEAAQKHEAEKQEAIRSGNATQIAKFQNELSNQELRDALDRLNSKQRLSDMVAKETPKKKTKLDRAMEVADKASKYADVAEKGIKAYNTFAKVSNAFADDKNQLPIIGEKRNKDEKDSKKEAAIRSGDPNQIKKWQGKLTPEETKTAMLTADYWKKINSQTTTETIKTGEKAAAEELRKKLSTHSDAYNEAVARVKEWDKRK